MRIVTVITLGVICLFASCSSLQVDRLLTADGGAVDTEISVLASMIVPMDNGISPESILAAREYIATLERKPVKDAVFEARLAAWSGRLYLLENKRVEAEKLLSRSLSFIPVDVPSLVLATRLERDIGSRLVRIDAALDLESDSGELLVERGLAYHELNLYRESAAAFDAAFPLLPEIYASVYAEKRNSAWTLRDVGPKDGVIAAIMLKPTVIWKDSHIAIRTETKLLDFLTAGKDWSPDRIHASLAERSFLPRGMETPVPLATEILTRSGAAYLVWHLIAQKRGESGLLNRYSTRWVSMNNVASPIPDVLLTSQYFDAVMGCIEWEIMSLPDGRKFYPDLPITGQDLVKMIKKAAQ